MRTPVRSVGALIAALDPRLRAEAVNCGDHTPLGPPQADSREVEPGDCFVAVRGLTVDGHGFIGQALSRGATFLIIDRNHRHDLGHDSPHLIVDDTFDALAILAAGWHGWPGERMALAGITGTNGKTTTAHLVSAIMHAAGAPHIRLGTTGNWLVDRESRSGFTTPFPVELQRLLADAHTRGATHGVMEVSSHALEQGRPKPLRFRAIGMTSFSQDHLDYHPTMAAYLGAKCLLAREYFKPGGLAVAPREQGEAAAKFLDIATSAGLGHGWRTSRTPVDVSEAEIAVVERHGHDLSATIRTPAGELELHSPLVGEFNLDNLLVAIGLSIGLGVERTHIEAGLAGASGAPGRLERVEIPGVDGPIVYIDYAHTPDAVARSLEALRPGVTQTGGRLVVLLGCGGDRDERKRPLMGEVASRGSDRFIATSDNPRTEDPDAILDQMIAGVSAPSEGGGELIREVDRAAAIAIAIAAADVDDVLLIAGKGHEDYQILGTTKIHFDDRKQAERALRARARPARG